MALGFGLVGVDRFLIVTMFPVIARDLHLSYGDIGLVTGALALAWSGAALFFGNISDRIGRRTVLCGSLALFALLIGASGLAVGILTLAATRFLMGMADGAYTPTSIAATLENSAPHRQGLNIGIQGMMQPLLGLAIAPLVVSHLLQSVSWRWIFTAFAVPAAMLAVAAWRVMPPTSPRANPAGRLTDDWREVLSHRNVRLGAVLMLCWLTCLITTSAFLPNYLIDHLKLPFTQMGGIMSAIGLGSTLGTFSLACLSDVVGRKPVMVLATVGAFLSLLLLAAADAGFWWLFSSVFLVHFFNNALITLTVGPLCSDTVPSALLATASGLVIAVGELFGGAVAPVVVGQVAQRIGIVNIFWLPEVMIVVGFLLCLFIQPTAPRVALPKVLA